MDPIQLFENWLAAELKESREALPKACCLSTIGLDGYPNSRFVSLKEVVHNAFAITGPLNSRKGQEIKNCSKAALSFWWPTSQRQVRIQGNVIPINKNDALTYFKERNRDSQIVSAIFNQGEEIQNIEQLQTTFSKKKVKFENKEIELPDNWGGIHIKPVRIEFMEFKQSRLHERTLFQQINNKWESTILQP